MPRTKLPFYLFAEELDLEMLDTIRGTRKRSQYIRHTFMDAHKDNVDRHIAEQKRATRTERIRKDPQGYLNSLLNEFPEIIGPLEAEGFEIIVHSTKHPN